MSERRISEGISGYWHYHLSDVPFSTKALCGAQTMTTEIPLSGWRVPFGEHFPKRPTWCDKCESLAALAIREGD